MDEPVRVAITFEENNVTTVIDGVTEDSTPVGSIPDPGTDTFFGSNNTSNYYRRIIDSVALYRKKLSEDELSKDIVLQTWLNST
jgi:hypothetical protein